MNITITRNEKAIEYPETYPFAVRTADSSAYFFVSKLSNSDKVAMILLDANEAKEHVGECALVTEEEMKTNFINKVYLLVDSELVLNDK
jgi:Ni,Fe-hydrogenase maturation factor